MPRTGYLSLINDYCRGGALTAARGAAAITNLARKAYSLPPLSARSRSMQRRDFKVEDALC